MAFDPNEHLIQFKGKDYLPVAWRLAWLREAAPDAITVTELIERTDTFALFKATVTLPTGASATGWGSETRADFGDFIEKSETKALGRALAALGFGIQHAAELDEDGSVADAPVERKRATSAVSAAAGSPIEPLPSANLAQRPEPDAELVQAKAKLDDARLVRGLGWEDVRKLAARAWPHITTKEELGLLTSFQIGRLTEVLTGESVIDSGGKIVPAPAKGDADLPLGVVGEIAAAVK